MIEISWKVCGVLVFFLGVLFCDNGLSCIGLELLGVCCVRRLNSRGRSIVALKQAVI